MPRLEVHQFLESGFLKTQWIQTGLKHLEMYTFLDSCRRNHMKSVKHARTG
jgi:hypothetical protein